MQEKSMPKRYVDKEITLLEYRNWWAQSKGYNNYNEYTKIYGKQYRIQNKEKIKSTKDRWYEKNKQKDANTQKSYRKNNKEKVQHLNVEYNKKTNYASQKKYQKTINGKKNRRKYRCTPKSKIADSKSIAKRKRELGYNVLNELDATTIGFEGHHLNKEDVLYIPIDLHKSIKHSVTNNINMDKINELVITWYIMYYGLKDLFRII